ncbi:MAG: imidazoleglycerol-phosphate dehydratase [Candidatus Omnitrophica bacterium]|nr:imidazoleglycerol-phosphate dehydratase [Candidatus Omnitrophota bacterium]
MAPRTAEVERKSKETHIKAGINIDGRGDRCDVKTGIGFLDHMIELFAFHGLFDLELEVIKSDTVIDIHHTNEDLGIVLGKAFKQALGDKAGIHRFGCAGAPMEATVARAVVDISGRGYFRLNIEEDKVVQIGEKQEYSLSYLEHFMESFAHSLGATISITLQNVSDDVHTNVEAAFKALGLALYQAVQVDPRREGIVPSTKGIID